MKKQITIICFFIASFATAQQLPQGSKLVGVQTCIAAGDLYYNSLIISAGQGRSELGILLTPTYGWFLAENWLVGGQLTLGVGRSSYDYFPSSSLKNTTNFFDFGIAPFTRYYIDITRNKKFKFFGMASLEFIHGSSTQKNTGIINTYKYTSNNIDGSIGFGTAFFGKKMGGDLSVSNMGLRFGLYKIINKKNK